MRPIRTALTNSLAGSGSTPFDVRLPKEGDHSGAMSATAGRVRRTSPTTGYDFSNHRADFACGYEIDIAPSDDRSPEQWGRAAWEGAPGLVRLFILAGWRFVLRLRLGPRPSPDHILGWEIVDRRPDETVCQLRSSFLHAYNTFRRADGRLVWSTYVMYDRPIAKVIWPPASLFHRPLLRIALRRAAVHP